MSDETFGLNMTKEDASELSRLLLGSVQRLLDLKQWNSFIKLQAIEDPFKFISDVQTHGDTLEKEDENKGFYHLRITGVTTAGQSNKIPCIKALRYIMNWGLAESKYSFEDLPGGGGTRQDTNFTIVSRGFPTREDFEQSEQWKEFKTVSNYFTYDIARLPVGTDQSKPKTNY